MSYREYGYDVRWLGDGFRGDARRYCKRILMGDRFLEEVFGYKKLLRYVKGCWCVWRDSMWVKGWLGY